MSIFLLFSFLAYSSANHHVNWFVCSVVFINVKLKISLNVCAIDQAALTTVDTFKIVLFVVSELSYSSVMR
jgi:hypothetical protein